MRRFKSTLTALVLILLSVAPNTVAQQLEPLPVDPNLRYGKLENGLTYYIRHNKHPENRADFYIAQNVGSILENESQLGLAHFLEHMAFNGTENFPGKSMLNYLESIGVKFGENVNAYTGFDETVYNLSNVPVVREGVVDTCLMVLSDWSSAIALEDEEIDNERGVIHEEWRTRNSAQQRMWEALVPVMFEGSQYANRMPIGSMDIVLNFPYKTLRDYYHKWYRPDLQGIIIVGDIDVDHVEAKVKELFGKIVLPEDAAERVYYTVPDNEEPIVAISKDKESTSTNIMVFYKHDPMPKEQKESYLGLLEDYMKYLASHMLNARMEEMVQKPNAPFLGGYAYDDNFFVSKTKQAFTTIAVSKNDGVELALAALLRETQRVDQFGFTASELARAKADFTTLLEGQYKERDKNRNSTYVDEYVNHFTSGGTVAGIEMEYQIYNQLAPMVTLEMVNKYAQELISDKNVVIAIAGVDAEGVDYPAKEEVLEIFHQAAKEPLEAYVDVVSDEPLMSELPVAGKVVKTETDAKFGTTIWTLSNGAKVVVKPTDFKADEILLKGESKGGKLLYDVQENPQLNLFNDVIALGGLSQFSAVDLTKVMAGKDASVSLEISGLSEHVSGSTTPKDIESMFQLLYLNFTQQRKDVEAFDAWKERTLPQLENMNANPQKAFSDSLTATLYNHSPYLQPVTTEMLGQVDYDRVLSIWKERYGNAGDFVFTIVGNVDLETLKPLVEKYVASLPDNGVREESDNTKIFYNTNSETNEFERASQTDKATVYAVYTGEAQSSLENEIKSSIFKQIMDIVYTKTIREEEGGTYGVGTQMALSKDQEQFLFLLGFDTNLEAKDKLLARAHKELQEMANSGVSEVDLNKVKEFMLKRNTELQRENGYWLGNLNRYYVDGDDYMTDYQVVVSAQTIDSLRKFTQQLFDDAALLEVVMNQKAEK